MISNSVSVLVIWTNPYEYRMNPMNPTRSTNAINETVSDSARKIATTPKTNAITSVIIVGRSGRFVFRRFISASTVDVGVAVGVGMGMGVGTVG